MKIAKSLGQSLLVAALSGSAVEGLRGSPETRELSAPAEYFVACGDPGRSDGASKCRADDGSWTPYASGAVEETHAVRCCLDVTESAGLTGEKDMCDGPHSISNINVDGQDECFGAATFTEAEGLCASQGGRLCTVWEILDDCTRSSGCGFDLEHVWTSTPYEETLPRDPSIPFSDGSHYVTCGDPDRESATDCKTDGQFKMTTSADDMEEHEVRCCSNSPLNWSGAKEMCDGVWGGSTVPELGCVASKNYLQAKAICEANDARLCTVWEVQNHCTQSSGCGFDNHYVWTDTDVVEGPVPRDPSVPYSEDDHLLVCGDPDRNTNGCKRNGVLGSPVEAQDMEQHVVRCCSDEELSWSQARSTCPGVWGGTNVPVDGQEKCLAAKNYLQAEKFCTDAGARLCTAEEAMMECTQGTGCGFDSYFFWTSTSAEEGYSAPTAAPTVPIEQFDTDHWLVCGDPDRVSASGCKDGNGDFHATFQADGMEKNEVRCCSDGKLDWMDGMAKNREQWCGDVWGASIINGECYSDKTYGEAKRICEDNGARLCTQAELANGCAEGTGCSHDLDWVWSSTEVEEGTALEPSNAYHFAACGSPAQTSAPLCQRQNAFIHALSAEDSTDFEVRCCSEKELPWFSNSPVRKNSGCSVYGISEIPIIPGSIANTVCMSAKSHWEAEAICSSNGARLCTVEEVVKGCARGSGCGYDAHMVWTYTPACTNEEECEALKHKDKHQGCFLDTRADQRLVFNLGSPFSIDTCYDHCHKAGYAYFGLKEGHNCFCGDAMDLTKEITDEPEHSCNRPCALGGYAGCGGGDAIDLYTTALAPTGTDNYESKYLGCYKDDIKAMTLINPDSSITSCVDECTNHAEKYSLASLYNSTQCFCGKSLLESRANDCGLACTNGKGLCGGLTGRSLYKTNNNIKPLQSLLQCRGSRASWWGDPHFTTFDGLKYNCQGIGHFIMTECIDYQLQGMFKAATGSNNKASVTDGIAATYKSFPKVQVSIADWESEYTAVVNSCPVHVFVGGKLVNQTADIIHDVIDITRSGPGFDIQFPAGGPALRVKVRKGRGCLVDVDTCVPEACAKTAIGLLGTPNGDQTDDWMYRDGTTYWPRPNNYKGKGGFDYCTTEWCVQTMGDSLFTYGPDKTFDMYDECAVDFPGEVDTEDLPDDIKEECKKAIDEDGCLTEAAVGGREAVEETLDNDLDMDQDDDEEEYIDDPNPPNCPADVELIGQIGRDFENWPVKVLEYGTTTVKLEIKSPLRVSQIGNYFHVQYPKKSGAQDSCDGFHEVDKTFKTEVEVQCLHSSPYALVHVFATDDEAYGEEDNAEIFPCCHAPEDALSKPTVQYTFAVSCVKLCPEDFYQIE